MTSSSLSPARGHCISLTGIELSILEAVEKSAVWSSRVQVVQKLVNTNPGLKVNQGNNFSCIKVFWHSLRLLMLKTEGQKI